MSLRSSMKNIVSKLKGWKLAVVVAGGLSLAAIAGGFGLTYLPEVLPGEKRKIEATINSADAYLKANPDFLEKYKTGETKKGYIELPDSYMDTGLLVLRAEGKLTNKNLRTDEFPYAQIREARKFFEGLKFWK